MSVRAKARADAIVAGSLMPAALPAIEPAEWTVSLPDIAATNRLARSLAPLLAPDQMVLLWGDLGTGKTSFARALICHLTGEPSLEVPSPTFSIVQSYQANDLPVVHADLYRISDASEIREIGLEDMARGALMIVEWPEKLGALAGADRLEIRLDLQAEGDLERRSAAITGHGKVASRIRREAAVAGFLEGTPWQFAERDLVQGDASSRAYERLRAGDDTAILMIAPPRTDTKAIRNGRSYLQIARLQETVHAFAAIDQILIENGFRAPVIEKMRLDDGLLIVEDMGSEGIAVDGMPDEARYSAVAEMLGRLHSIDWPDEIPMEGGRRHRIPLYDLDALQVEAELLLDWYIPPQRRGNFSGSARSRYLKAWSDALNPVIASARTLTLRDLHSPNVLWQPKAEGHARIGLIDFQDAVLGHPAYDVASLAQDARLTIAPALEVKILGAYLRSRPGGRQDFQIFLAHYAVMAAQRASKIMGIFARLEERDGKPQYRRHLPRIEAYLRRNLKHAALAPVTAWFQDYLPAVLVETP
jgi:N-acetylmuramate 1-kinase